MPNRGTGHGTCEESQRFDLHSITILLVRSVRRSPFVHPLALAAIIALSAASPLAAQGVAGVRRGGEAIIGSPCPEMDVPLAGPDVARGDRVVAPLPVESDTIPRRPVAIALLASAEAREVRFAREPRVRVRLCGGLDSVRVVERRNLPRPVVAGQTYRNVYVAVEILGRLDAECLAERLGVRDAAGEARGACAALSVEGGAASTRARPDSTTSSGGGGG